MAKEPKDLATKDGLTEFLLYTTPEGKIKVEAFFHDENVWLSQKRMAELFGVDVRTISEHLRNIFKSSELSEDSVIRKFRITAADGKGYGRRVNGKLESAQKRMKRSRKVLSRLENARGHRKETRNPAP